MVFDFRFENLNSACLLSNPITSWRFRLQIEPIDPQKCSSGFSHAEHSEAFCSAVAISRRAPSPAPIGPV
jgi:hypothetical protein